MFPVYILNIMHIYIVCTYPPTIQVSMYIYSSRGSVAVHLQAFLAEWEKIHGHHPHRLMSHHIAVLYNIKMKLFVYIKCTYSLDEIILVSTIAPSRGYIKSIYMYVNCQNINITVSVNFTL